MLQIFASRPGRERILECLLILICIGLAALLHAVVGYKMVVLNLFYLPIVLAAFYLGRLCAGMLALFCVLMATIVAVLDLQSFAVTTTPLIIGLSLTVWAAVMGLNAIIVGTLSDERSDKLADLHDAYLGVVDVLARYLKSGDPELIDRSTRVAALSQAVARQLRLSDQEIDDVRVAALLRDINHIEVTATVIHRAFGDLSEESVSQPHTFHGSELMQSLGSVLTSALPLIVSQPDGSNMPVGAGPAEPTEVPFGAAIIHAVHRFDALVHGHDQSLAATEALHLMRTELDGDYHEAVLHALGQIMLDRSTRSIEQLDALETIVRAEIGNDVERPTSNFEHRS